MAINLKENICFTNPEALTSAARVMGGRALGFGEHRLGDRRVQGFGFALPGWRFPLVAAHDGALAFESSRTEDQSEDLLRFKRWYILSVVGQTARDHQWRTHFDVDSGRLMIVHPQGAKLSVSKDGHIDVNNFSDPGSTEAVSRIEEALTATAPPPPPRPRTQPAAPPPIAASAVRRPAAPKEVPVTPASSPAFAERAEALPASAVSALPIEPPPPAVPLPPPIKLVICNTATAKEPAVRTSCYAGRGDLFWSILAETGLLSRRLKPEEFASLEEFGIAIVDLPKAAPAAGAKKVAKGKEYDLEAWQAKLLALAPQVVAFNGKAAATAALKLPAKKLAYGELEQKLGDAALFVLPATAVKSRAQWDPRHWFDLARLLTKFSAEAAEAQRAAASLVESSGEAARLEAAEHAAALFRPRPLTYRVVVAELAAKLAEAAMARIIAALQELEDEQLADDDSVLWNPWDELCDQLQSGHFFAWEAYEPAVRRCTETAVAGLESSELDAIWLQCDEAAGFRDGDPRGVPTYPFKVEQVIHYFLRRLYSKALDWKNVRSRQYQQSSH
jgi:TDG/mug DNA glycosylase family protein